MAVMSNKIENGFTRLDNINSWINNCDSKSSYILTFFGVVVTIIFTSDIGKEMISTLDFYSSNEVTKESFYNFTQLFLFLLFLLSSLVTLYFIYNTLKAKINTSIYTQDDLVTSSNIFFGTISTKEFKDFNNQVKAETEGSLINDLNSQIFINSNIANAKFKNYNLSLKFMTITFLIFLLYVIIK
jgi:hypothetical protein